MHLTRERPRELRVDADAGDARRAAEKRVRVGADDVRDAHRFPAPGTVVPPLDVAVTQPRLGRTPASFDPVDEEEPVPPARRGPLDAFDRLHEAAAVACRDVELAVERLHRRQPGRDAARVDEVRTAVFRHPQGGGSVLALAATTGSGEREHEDEREPHFTAFERTAPAAVARTSTPGCGPGHPSTFWFALTVRLEPM